MLLLILYCTRIKALFQNLGIVLYTTADCIRDSIAVLIYIGLDADPLPPYFDNSRLVEIHGTRKLNGLHN